MHIKNFDTAVFQTHTHTHAHTYIHSLVLYANFSSIITVTFNQCVWTDKIKLESKMFCKSLCYIWYHHLNFIIPVPTALGCSVINFWHLTACTPKYPSKAFSLTLALFICCNKSPAFYIIVVLALIRVLNDLANVFFHRKVLILNLAFFDNWD